MANIKSAKKRIDVAEKKRVQNKSKKSEINTFVKKFNAAAAAGDKVRAGELLSECYSLLDAAAGDGIIHMNKAARVKGQLAKKMPA